MIRVKICGITNLADARCAVRAGADAVGFVFAKSARRAEPATVQKITRWVQAQAMTVGVFVDESPERMLRIGELCRLSAIQLHGDESPRVVRCLQKHGFQVLKAVRARDKDDLKKVYDTGADAVLFDTVSGLQFGGTGQIFDWDILSRQKLSLPWFVSGGLNTQNVKKLLSKLTPYGVDVSSGVETAPGKKNARWVKEFVKNVRTAG